MAKSVWLCVASGVAGVFAIFQPRFAAGDYTLLVVVAVSVFTALAMMGLHHLRDLDPRAIVVHFSATALAFALTAAVLLPPSAVQEEFAPRHVALLVAIGVCATFGQYFLTRAFTTGDPARLSVVNLTQIVFVLLLDMALLDRPLEQSKLLGIPLILGPAAWLMYRQTRRARRPHEARPQLSLNGASHVATPEPGLQAADCKGHEQAP
jgi:drug/metabolite transporter (DMT)-like permease